MRTWLSNGLLGAAVLSAAVATPRRASAMPQSAHRAVAGVVVDRAGAPIAGVRIEAVRVEGGPTTRTTSGADGTFAVALSADAPHVLSARGPAAFLEWGAIEPSAATFAPGARDVRIVLDVWRRADFAVVDGESGAPVPRYEIRIREDARCGWRCTASAPWQEIPSRGVTALPIGAAPATVEVRVPREIDPLGSDRPPLVDFQGPVALDADGRMTIRLARGGRIRLKTPMPLVGPRAPLAREDEVVARRAGPDGTFVEVARARREGQDRFRKTLVVPPATYQIVARVEGYEDRVIEDVVVRANDTIDLGPIGMVKNAIASVRLVAPDGVFLGGLRVRVDDREKVEVATIAGELTFYDLRAGTHVLTLLADPPRVPAERRLAFDTQSARDGAIVFDIRD